MVTAWRRYKGSDAGLRLTAGGSVFVYTGDTGPNPEVAELASDADLFLAEATYIDEVPEDSRPFLSHARQVGQDAAHANVRRLLLTHLWPGTDPQAARTAAAQAYHGEIGVATADLEVDLTAYLS